MFLRLEITFSASLRVPEETRDDRPESELFSASGELLYLRRGMVSDSEKLAQVPMCRLPGSSNPNYGSIFKEKVSAIFLGVGFCLFRDQLSISNSSRSSP